MLFNDKVFLDKNGKTLVSARDGVMLYDGAEIGEEKGRVYKVYRPLSELKKIGMVGIPITNEHVSHNKPFTALGSVRTSTLRARQSNADMQSHELFHDVILCDDLQVIVNKGKKELSLGYDAKLIPAEKPDGAFDFVQTNIIPHHLAVVDKGRCGGVCEFTDKEQDMTLKEILEAIKKLPDTEKMALMKELSPKPEANAKTETKPEPKPETKPETKPEPKPEAKPEKVADAPVDDAGVKVEDMASKIADEAQKLADEYSNVVIRAMKLKCLPHDYSFTGKKATDIMRDCVSTQHSEAFDDAEVKIAFKMLKPVVNRYADFGKQSEFEIKDEEIPSAFSDKIN